MNRTLLIALFILGACTQATQVTTPSGEHGYVIDCNSNFSSMAECYKRASELCPHGYDIESKDRNDFDTFRSLVINCNNRSMKQAQEEMISRPEVEDQGCMKDEDCGHGLKCATVKGELPGSCASP